MSQQVYVPFFHSSPTPLPLSLPHFFWCRRETKQQLLQKTSDADQLSSQQVQVLTLQTAEASHQFGRRLSSLELMKLTWMTLTRRPETTIALILKSEAKTRAVAADANYFGCKNCANTRQVLSVNLSSSGTRDLMRVTTFAPKTPFNGNTCKAQLYPQKSYFVKRLNCKTSE